MGICASAALRITVFDPNKTKHVYSFSMKQLRTFQTIGDVLSVTNIELSPRDRIYRQTPWGIEELKTHSQFQIQNIIVKTGSHSIKYKLLMEHLY
jgi:hypothetical protein